MLATSTARTAKLWFSALTLTLASSFAWSADSNPVAPEFVEGTHYEVLAQPIAVSDPTKVEVVEFFWYGCSHCYHFEPTVEPWAKQLPKDVEFKQVPAVLSEQWEAGGQLFYALKAMNEETRLRPIIFKAMVEDKEKLFTPDVNADFVAKNGVNREEFLKYYNAFSVKTEVSKARKLIEESKASGVPTLLIQGTYRFDVAQAGGPEQAIKLANMLIDKSRQKLKSP